MRFEAINTERLTIRRLRLEDAASISLYRSLPEVSKFQSWKEYSSDKASELIKEMETSDPSEKGKWFQFGISLKSSNELVGDIGFLNSDLNQKSWIGFTLNSRHWGKGYAFESVKAVLNYYAVQGISGVWASVDPQNNPSINLLKKLKFNLIDIKPNDHVFFKILI